MITETDQISQALDTADQIWPELGGDRAALLRKIIEAGVHELENQQTLKREARLSQIKKLAGSMDEVWPKNWREELSQEWPK